ncbi:VWA domain-containing protein [Neiella sp. HB171785]|uniref:VWA domain-containing protein n=1 Tax=Neiella litorisoli TaxID=2771431 RepID=A0A8J6UGN6_9GAMM|nr:VWA domain-containing protein [Neiella litorisoli]MBD1390451.1 VWA domain-containing protein [Neiella litorisoli]
MFSHQLKRPNYFFATSCLVFALSACSQTKTAGDNQAAQQAAPTPPAEQVAVIAATLPPPAEMAAEQYQQDQAIKQSSKRMVAPQPMVLSAGIAADSSGYIAAVHGNNYQKLTDNSVKLVAEEPVSTFSADVDTASYANVRHWLEGGRLPPTDAVRVEEMLNYFRYDYPQAASAAEPINIDTLLTTAPWDHNRHLLRIGINSFQPDSSARPNANLVMLVDVSGSMRAANKLPLVKQSLSLLLSQLRAEDRIAIVTYAGGAEVALASTPVSERTTIERAIAGLQAGGSTHGSAGIQLAYQQAQQHMIDQGINQIMLLSDGDLNVGITDIDELKQLIKTKRQHGVQFSTLGFGQGNYNDHLMEQLADLGNGMAGYIDTLHEAQKILVDQLGSSLQVVAHDVKLQIEFNPAVVAEYRLIGYENRALNREDFNEDRKDAGDIGAGHSVTALYELTLVGSPSRIEPLVFQSDNRQRSQGADLAELRVRYKLAQQQPSQLQRIRIEQQPVAAQDLSSDDQFAIAVAAFGQKLRNNDYLANFDYAELITLANAGKGADPFGYRAEFVRLLRLAQSLSQQTGEQVGDQPQLTQTMNTKPARPGVVIERALNDPAK